MIYFNLRRIAFTEIGGVSYIRAPIRLADMDDNYTFRGTLKVLGDPTLRKYLLLQPGMLCRTVYPIWIGKTQVAAGSFLHVKRCLLHTLNNKRGYQIELHIRTENSNDEHLWRQTFTVDATPRRFPFEEAVWVPLTGGVPQKLVLREEPPWVTGARAVQRPPEHSREIQVFGDVNFGITTDIFRVLYEGQIYYAKTSRDDNADHEDQEHTRILPQGRVMKYLQEHNIAGICHVSRYVELEDGHNLLLFDPLPAGHTLTDHRFEYREDVVRAIVDLARIVKALHDIGVFHWDLKSQNVWVTDDGRIILYDFDLAFMSVESFVGRGLNMLASPGYASEHRMNMNCLSVDFSIEDEIFSLARMLAEKWQESWTYHAKPFSPDPTLTRALMGYVKTIEEFIELVEALLPR